MRSVKNFSGLPPPNGVYKYPMLLEQSARTITNWKLCLNILRLGSTNSDRSKRPQLELNIEDDGTLDRYSVQDIDAGMEGA